MLATKECEPLYVWSTEIDIEDVPTDMNEKIADQLESAIVYYTPCKVLNRRNYGLHEIHRSNERIIRSINDLNSATVNGLKTIQAKWVVFSNITLDILGTDSIYTFTSSLEDLSTSQIIAKTENFINKSDLLDPISRAIIAKIVAQNLFNSENSTSNLVRSSKEKAKGMKTVTDVSRSIADRYIQSSNQNSWNEAEDYYIQGKEAFDKQQFAIAQKFFEQANDSYHQVYLSGQSKGAMDEAKVFSQIANSALKSVVCAFDISRCSKIRVLKNQADSLFKMEEYRQAGLLYQLVQQQSVEFLANYYSKKNYQFDLVQEIHFEVTLEKDQKLTASIQSLGYLKDVVEGPYYSKDAIADREFDKRFPKGSILFKLPWKKKWKMLEENQKYKTLAGSCTIKFKVNLDKDTTPNEMKVHRIKININ